MEKETGRVYEWKIENLSHWRAEVHGHFIWSPQISSGFFHGMQLYPMGMSGHGEHLVVILYGEFHCSFSGELSFYSSNGSLLCIKQQVIKKNFKCLLVLPSGPKLEDVLSIIRESEDFITVKLLIKGYGPYKIRVCTTIYVLKISLEINPGWIETMESNATKEVFYIELSPTDNLKRMWLKICSENNKVHFTITPPTEYEDPFAVDMSVSLTRSDDTVVRCAKKERVFRDDSPWTFPDSLQKKELLGKAICLSFCLTTKDLVESPLYMSCSDSCVSIESMNKICFPQKEPTTDAVASNTVAVLTKDSGSQTSLTSDDSELVLLSKELMCLYQDQKYSDVTLKCDSVSFPVHKAILSARSPVLDRLLSSDMKEAASGEVDIEDLDPSTLSRFLTYLYTGAVEEELQCDSALKLYYAADKYQVPSLKKECSKFLCDNMSVSNVCDILSSADRHGDDELTSLAEKFILYNYNDVLKSKEWESFMCRKSLLAVKTLTHFAAKDSVCQKA